VVIPELLVSAVQGERMEFDRVLITLHLQALGQSDLAHKLEGVVPVL
jgi:hypothetical protein